MLGRKFNLYEIIIIGKSHNLIHFAEFPLGSGHALVFEMFHYVHGVWGKAKP